MSYPQQPAFQPPRPPKPPRKGLRALGWAAVSVGALFVLFLGIGVIGAIASGGVQRASSTAPAPTVTVPGPSTTVSVPGPEKTVTVPGPTMTATKQVTPTSCGDALAKADEVMTLDNQAFQISADAMGNTARTFDFSYLDTASGQLKAIAPKKQAAWAAYQGAAADCRAGK